MRLDTLPSSIIVYILLLTSPTQASVDVDFSAYPASARSCLTEAVATSGCSSKDTVSEMNDCLCSNSGNFVLDSADCLGGLGSADTMSKVYEIMQQSCSETKTPLSISEAQWLAEGNEETAVTSTVTTTIGTMVLTFSTTITPASTASSTSASTTSTSRTKSDDEDEDEESSTDEHEDDELSLSAKIGVITSSIAGAMTLACIACMIIFFTKRKKDKQLLAEARAAAARAQDKDKDQNRNLLSPGAMTPGLPSPAGQGGVTGHEGQVFGATVVPPTPAYPGPSEAQAWRGGPQGTTASPSELTGDSAVFQLYDGHAPHNPSAWPSPLTLPSRGFPSRTTTLRSESSWCPSPASAFASSNALGMYGQGPAGAGSTGTASAVTSPITRQITSTTRSSWAHNRPYQEEPYELPGMEARSPVEADSNPITKMPEDSIRLSTPPEYSTGDWVDPNTDKPPI